VVEHSVAGRDGIPDLAGDGPALTQAAEDLASQHVDEGLLRDHRPRFAVS
jgi:hypothetical protein